MEILSLRSLLFTILRVESSTSLHQALHVTMSLAINYLTTTFDWFTTLLVNLKRKLISIKRSNTKHFGYGTILCTFFFKRLPGLRPKELSNISSPRDPCIGRWVDFMKRLWGGQVPRTSFDGNFFLWLEQQVNSIEDYPCVSMVFIVDPDLVLPPNMHGVP